MKKRIITKFELLSLSEAKNMAESIRAGTFTLEAENSTPETIPDGVYDVLCDNKFYRQTLADETAFFKCIFLYFENSDFELIKIPVSLYGVSDKNKTHFPIIIGNIITALITFDKQVLSQLLKFSDQNEENEAWMKLGEIKKEIMSRIFSFYGESSGEFNAIMAWSIKSEKSLTRKVAESNGFKRFEIPHLKTEVYNNKSLDEKAFKYINDCVIRWINLAPSKPQKDVKVSDPEKYVILISAFLSILVEPKKIY